MTPDAGEIAASLTTEAYTPLAIPPTGFLRLPRDIRVRVYIHAGVAYRGSEYSLDLGRSNVYGGKGQFAVAYQLMLTCKALYADVASMLYRKMSPHICYDTNSNLAGLRCLTPVALRALKKLTIDLNRIHCHRSFICGHEIFQNDPADLDIPMPNVPLCLSDDQSRRRIDEWLGFWQDLRKCLLPGRLKLILSCDVADYDTAVAVTEPFFLCSQGPRSRLADCTIRLGRHPDSALSMLARRAVAVATTGKDITEEASPNFRFQDLPKELRLHVLSFTDLVTPNEEVEWNPTSHGYYTRYPPYNYEDAWKGIGRCNNSRRVDCCCRAAHAAYSSEFSCRCWGYPTSLFLVCRSLHEEAKRTFFGLNRIVITPAGGRPWATVEHSDRLPVSIFLKDVVPADALQHIRSLEIVFPSIAEKTTYCRVQSPEWLDWVNTLDHIKDKLNLPALTLKLVFPEHHPMDEHSMSRRDTFGYMPAYFEHNERSNEVQKSYRDTIAPLRKLQGLSRFFAHLAHPRGEWWYYWTRRPQRDHDAEVGHMERRAEKLIMGDGYEAGAVGKNDMPKSLWLVDSECFEMNNYY